MLRLEQVRRRRHQLRHLRLNLLHFKHRLLQPGLVARVDLLRLVDLGTRRANIVRLAQARPTPPQDPVGLPVEDSAPNGPAVDQ